MEDYKKKYEDALERCKKEFNFNNLAYSHEEIKQRLERVFPELKGSEDESWIPKEIIKYLKEKGDFRSCWLSWLEKQSKPQVKTGIEWVNAIDDACEHRYAEEYAHGEYCHEQSFRWGFQEGVDWFERQGEQNPAWSEEDENMLKSIIATCELAEQDRDSLPARHLLEMQTNWLKFLKERVQPQPKQEWSEEDKGNLLDVKCIIDEVWRNQDVREELDHSVEELESLWHWLDNIWQRVEYPQSTWFPSNEQMDALNIAIGEANSVDTAAGDEAAGILTSLYEALKKLKGE